MLCRYQDTATFVKVSPSGYGDNKTVSEQSEVPVIFSQSVGFRRNNNQDAVTADATCWPDPQSEFIVENNNRLEGMYILAPLFGVEDEEGWYKVVNVIVSRDHLLTNTIDNIELLLKKTRRIAGVS